MAWCCSFRASAATVQEWSGFSVDKLLIKIWQKWQLSSEHVSVHSSKPNMLHSMIIVRWNAFAHYSDVIMSAMASQLTGVSIVYSTVCYGADKGKYQSSASLAFVRELTGGRWIPHTKGQQRGKEWFWHAWKIVSHYVVIKQQSRNYVDEIPWAYLLN